MLAKIDTQRLELAPKSAASQPAGNQASYHPAFRGLLRDSLPYCYLTAGFAALFATLHISDWFWVLPYSLLAMGGVLHIVYLMISRGPQPEDRGAPGVPASPHD